MKDFKAIYRFLVPHKKQVFLSLFCHILMAVFTIVSIPLIIPFFHFLFDTIPDKAIRPESYLDLIGWLEYFFVILINAYGPQQALLYTCGFLVLIFFLKNLFRYLAMYFIIPVRSNIVTELRSKLYQSYLSMSLIEDKRYKRGDLIARMTADVQEVEWSILRFIQTIFKAPILILGSVFLMLSIHSGLSLFVFALMIFTVVVIGTLSKTLKKSSKQLQNTMGELTSKVDETLDGALLLKVYRVIDSWKQKFARTNLRHKELYDKVTRRQELSSPVSEFLGVTVVVILLWYGAQLVFKQQLRPEAFFAFVFAFYHVIEPLKSFSTAFYNIRKGSASLDRINALTGDTLYIGKLANRNYKFDQQLCFDKVSFSYDEIKVLDKISFCINRGEKLALVGDSGAGKSTIVSLLLGIIRPDAGQLTLDGSPLEEIDKHAYFKKIGLVTQRAFLFNDKVVNNITMGRQGFSEQDIQKSLEIANADGFVAQLPAQLDTIIGDRGEQLSGGERQRLTIARAILENPELLILDEPTAALDPSSEFKVSAALTKAMKGRTTIIIAHRLSTIRHCDRILFVDKGEIVESGTHEELIALNGKYQDYVALQSI